MPREQRKNNMTDAEMVAWLETKYTLNENGCWIWNGAKTKSGYGQVKCKVTTRVHRAYWLLSGRTIPEGLVMCHGQNCSKACFNPEHMKPGTAVENQADRIRDGTDTRGEKNPAAKLTEVQVLAIRANVENKTQKELAKEFGVYQGIISAIINRQTWKHI